MSKGEFELIDVNVIDKDMMIAKVKINADETKVEVRYVKMVKYVPNIEQDEIRMFVDTEDEELKRRIYRFLMGEFRENEETKLAVLMFFGEEYFGI
ncbi:hypothetical protein COA01_23065 [Bacillus cereus]|uniref:hypothetical protein n=1 Tax=Bacillus cereus TaxID=1396 RepID=UPI000BFC11ED|nr:hypothetical protein [Bacillus cereus]PGP18626.1 hypothetical protein COA01_23065 [Bacillus cereus]